MLAASGVGILLGLCPKPHQGNFLKKVSLDPSKTLKKEYIDLSCGEGAPHGLWIRKDRNETHRINPIFL
jgi:hypothetical protein